MVVSLSPRAESGPDAITVGWGWYGGSHCWPGMVVRPSRRVESDGEAFRRLGSCWEALKVGREWSIGSP